jgi:hypothetical protein
VNGSPMVATRSSARRTFSNSRAGWSRQHNRERHNRLDQSFPRRVRESDLEPIWLTWWLEMP